MEKIQQEKQDGKKAFPQNSSENHNMYCLTPEEVID